MGAQGGKVHSGFAVAVLEVDVALLVVDDVDATEADEVVVRVVNEVVVLDWEELLVNVTVGEMLVELLVRLDELFVEPAGELDGSEK
jgi:hypothetical protein